MAKSTNKHFKRMPAKTKQVRSVSLRASEYLSGLLEKAQDTIEIALLPEQEVILTCKATGQPLVDDEGNPQTTWIGGDSKVAMWLMDRMLPSKGGVLPTQIDADLSSIDGVIQCAEDATQMLLNRQMTLADCRYLMDHLLRYTQLKAYERIDELKLIVEAFESEASISKVNDGLLPKWGRLTTDTKTANKQPAE